jgi:hypothetical protein
MPLRFRYTLHQLRILQAVVEHGGITRAAEALHLTQPTVSMQIRQLNEGLGVTLFAPRGRLSWHLPGACCIRPNCWTSDWQRSRASSAAACA